MLRRNLSVLHQPNTGLHLGSEPRHRYTQSQLHGNRERISRINTGRSTPKMSSINTHDDNPYIRATALHLEDIARTFITPIDQRLLSSRSPSLIAPELDFIDPFFRAVPMPPWDHAPLDLEGYVTYIRTVVEANPSYSIKLTDVSSHINDKAGTADVYLNVEVGGMPPGVVRKSVGVMRFRKGDGRWRCYTYQGADGSGWE